MADKKKQHESTGLSFLKGGLLGAAVGLVGGLLFAPKSGKETRKDIKDTAVRTEREAEKRAKGLYNELSDYADQAKARVAELKGKAQKEAEDTSDRVSEMRDRVKEAISSLRDGEVEVAQVEKVLDRAEKLLEKSRKEVEKREK